MTPQEYADQLRTCLITKTRDNGQTYLCRSDDAPEWTLDAIRDAHGGMLPDDIRYRMIDEVADLLAASDDWDDIDVGELVDVYTSDLIKWVASYGRRIEYCDEAVSSMGTHPGNTVGLLQWGQHQEYEEILSSLRQTCESLAEDYDR